MKNSQQPVKGTRAYFENQYKIARSNLLIMIVFTCISVLLLWFGNTYLLFSAYVPIVLSIIGSACVSDPASIVGEGYTEENLRLAGSFGAILCIAIIVIFLVLFLFCWIFSKKRPGWMMTALILFVIDSLLMVWDMMGAFRADMILDIVFHVWIMYYFIIGTRAYWQLKKLPPDPESADLAAPSLAGSAITQYASVYPAEEASTPGEKTDTTHLS
ncbi:MAG TPA: hypothetical protein DER23_07395 [Clostridiales bacterium]|nr:hypothetical protein [Clostridiales bacterium]